MNRWIFAGAGALAAVLLLYVVVSAERPARDVAIGVPIRHDDFLFTVQRITTHRSGEMTHYDVAILVQNQALRVDYHWRDDIAYVAASNGERFPPASRGEFVLAPGQSRTATVRFGLPGTLAGPSLRFWDGIFMGDAFNGGAYAKASIPLDR